MAETSELSRRIEAAKAHQAATRQETDADRCTVCGNFADEHSQYRHAFTTAPNDLRERPTPPPPKRTLPSVLSTDIALRLALIDKGVLSADDILAAEKKLGLHSPLEELGQPAEAPTVAGHVD